MRAFSIRTPIPTTNGPRAAMPRALRPNRRALTLVELTIALILVSALTIVMLQLYAQQRQMQTARATALRMAQIIDAATKYITANTAAIAAATEDGPVAVPIAKLSPTGGQPTAPAGLKTLQAAGFLDASFVDTNYYGQSTRLILSSSGSGASALITGLLATRGGRAIPDVVLGYALEYLGPQGGAVLANPPSGTGNILGYKGSWQVSLATLGTLAPTAGHLAAQLPSVNAGSSDVIGNYLWRYNVGVPEANRMHTDIDMGQHSLNHVKQITGGPATPADAGGVNETAIHIANTIVPGLNSNSNVDPAASEYLDPSGNKYDFYIRPDGDTRLKKFDISAKIAWDSQGGTNPRNYPAGMRIVDALPPLTVMASYLAGDNTVIPKPACGNPATPDYTRARIFAIEVSKFDYGTPVADTATTTSWTEVPVLTQDTFLSTTSSVDSTGATVTNITLNKRIANIHSVDDVSTRVNVRPTATFSTMYADENAANSWLFRMQRKQGLYDPDGTTAAAATLIDQAPLTAVKAAYPTMAIVQTACYYGP